MNSMYSLKTSYTGSQIPNVNFLKMFRPRLLAHIGICPPASSKLRHLKPSKRNFLLPNTVGLCNFKRHAYNSFSSDIAPFTTKAQSMATGVPQSHTAPRDAPDKRLLPMHREAIRECLAALRCGIGQIDIDLEVLAVSGDNSINVEST